MAQGPRQIDLSGGAQAQTHVHGGANEKMESRSFFWIQSDRYKKKNTSTIKYILFLKHILQ